MTREPLEVVNSSGLTDALMYARSGAGTAGEAKEIEVTREPLEVVKFLRADRRELGGYQSSQPDL